MSICVVHVTLIVLRDVRKVAHDSTIRKLTL